ncbi:WD40 repeat domain-containing protein, partial [Saccharopolyspora shandongensis]|uniref:WD40 repeat domain-containing protein n=1 Tax=Saccharopolyspora shandongensis TaxID=418495 RepID=UPI00348E55C6
PKGNWLATASKDHTVRLWNTKGTLRTTLKAHTRSITAVAISPKGNWLATASKDHTVRLWNTKGTLRTTLKAHTGTVTAVAISPDGNWLATAGKDGWLRLWNSQQSKDVTAVRTEIGGPVAWFPDSSKLAVCGSRRPFGLRLVR